MKNRISIIIAALFVVLAIPARSYSQSLLTGETSGKNKGSAYPFVGDSVMNGAVTSNNGGTFIFGVTDHFDIIAIAGDMKTSDMNFGYVAFGGIIGLPTKKLGFDSLFYNLLTAPLNNRTNASPLLGNSVVVVSRQVKLGSYKITPFTGVLVSYALGSKDRILTTDTMTQVPVGVYCPINSKWALTFEYDHGRMKSKGAGLSYLFDLNQ